VVDTPLQNDEPHEVPQQLNNQFDERCHPLIMPQLSYSGNLVDFALIQYMRTTTAENVMRARLPK
jgi:hypothetical protein